MKNKFKGTVKEWNEYVEQERDRLQKIYDEGLKESKVIQTKKSNRRNSA